MIVFLTPDPEAGAIYARWREVFAQLAEPLRSAGLPLDTRPWTEPGELAGAGVVSPLLVWGYHHHEARWFEQVARWERQGVRLRNPASVLRWNADKRYLGRLAERGAPVAPTRYVDAVTREALHEAEHEFAVDRLVLKPQVSAGAHQTIVWEPGEPLAGGPEGAAMIQPYLPSIEDEGEVSLLYFDGAFSHAVRKTPRAGDFRVQPEYQGVITTHRPVDDERAAAEAVLAAVDEPLLYARVDLVRDLSGRPALIELELIEPDLYLEHAADNGAMFAQAMARAVA